MHIGEIRGSNVSNLFMQVFHGCFALQSGHNCHKREVGMDSACFIFYSYLRYRKVLGALSTSKEATSTPAKCHSDSRVQMPL